MGIIGLSPNNLISPIDFVPGLGPFNKARKGVIWANRARKSKKIKKLVASMKSKFWYGAASAEAVLEAHIFWRAGSWLVDNIDVPGPYIKPPIGFGFRPEY